MARKSYVQVKTENGYELVEKEHAYKFKSNKSAMVLDDMKPMVSPIDGDVISSRSQYREHMKKHGVIDVGNEKINPGIKKDYKPGDSIKRALYDAWSNCPQYHR